MRRAPASGSGNPPTSCRASGVFRTAGAAGGSLNLKSAANSPTRAQRGQPANRRAAPPTPRIPPAPLRLPHRGRPSRSTIHFEMTAKKSPSKKSAPAASPRAKKPTGNPAAGPITLAIDIGGSGLKAMLLDPSGRPVSERQRVPTPAVPTPRAVLRRPGQAPRRCSAFDRVSVGFPGVIKRGTTYSAFNLHPCWVGFPLQQRAGEALEEARPRGQRRRHPGLRRHQGRRRGDDHHPRHRHGLVALHRRPPLPRPRARPPSLEDARPTRTTSAAAASTNSARRPGTSSSSMPSPRPRPPSTGTTSTSAAATPRRSTFALPPNVKIVTNETGLLGGVALWRDWK